MKSNLDHDPAGRVAPQILRVLLCGLVLLALFAMLSRYAFRWAKQPRPEFVARWTSRGSAGSVAVWVPVGRAEESGMGLSPPSEEALSLATRIVSEEFARHSPALLARARIDRVGVGTHLVARGKKASGLALPRLGWLLVDATEDETVLRFAVQHELYHLLDQHLLLDPEWESKNPSGFRYDRLYAQSAGPAPAELDVSRRGFLSWYARSNAAEDKAEVFAFLTLKPAETRDAAARDGVLQAKVALLEARLGGGR